jgi:hypothetical protein
VWAEFIERYDLDKFQRSGPNHNQITKAVNFVDFDPPPVDWMAAKRSRSRAGAATPDAWTIMIDKPEHEEQLRSGLSTPGVKKKFVKLYVGKIGIGGEVENIEWPIGRVNY